MALKVVMYGTVLHALDKLSVLLGAVGLIVRGGVLIEERLISAVSYGNFCEPKTYPSVYSSWIGWLCAGDCWAVVSLVQSRDFLL